MMRRSLNLVSTQPKRLLLVALLVVGLVVAYAATVEAKPPQLPKITGGGVTLNENAGFGPGVTSVGGFNARATGPAVAGVYPAKGQLQGKLVSAAGVTLGTIHAQAVCMVNLGPGDAGTGGTPGIDVWEVRIKITNATGVSAPLVGFYGSAYYQDGGTTDFSDENFDSAHFGNSNCDVVKSFQLESVIAGNLKVHD